MLKNFFTFSRFTLFIALCISAIAAWYSVLGLTAIFAGAVIPIIIMGGILEIAKITTTVWLHRYWKRSGYAIRIYLTVAVVVLACLTSMGIFGLLSKAHLDQNVPSGDVAAQLSLYDEKIKTQRDNIDAARKALAQMDAQVEQRLARGDSESGAERAVQIRRQQAKERGQLQSEIAAAQKEIAKLNEERAPVASKLRKVEAEVGPVKYIAALIYGDNPDQTLLEKAVRWVIIMIVVVFDPLAIILILAANNSIRWDREGRKEEPAIIYVAGEDNPPLKEEVTEEPVPPAPEVVSEARVEEPPQKSEHQENNYDVIYDIVETPTTAPEVVESKPADPEPQPQPEPIAETKVEEVTTQPVVKQDKPTIETSGVTTKAKILDHEYVQIDGKNMSLAAAKSMMGHQAYDLALAEKNEILWGTAFPKVSHVGDIYTRVDVVPHMTYKFNGVRWIALNRRQSTSYLQNISYLQYLISKIDSGEYDPELLTEVEQDEISEYLKRTV